MNCGDFQQQIGGALDGALDAGAQAALEAHLATCEVCRGVQADLQRIRLLAGTLEEVPPPPEVWPRIAAAIEAERHAGWRVWRRQQRTRLLAAAAVVLLVAGGTWFAWRRLTPAPAARTVAAERAATNAQTTAAVESEIQQAEDHYNKAIATLQQAATSGSGTLDAQTTAVLQTNLGVIDTAIGESRQALHADPSNEVARQSLFDALRSKVALLEDTVALINEMRKGNQDGAARIVSGMKP
ncbi:MAG TPA: zf-HC2 domain-containing protein [Vicinamibacterales bacterium]|nr:zf-HC2 domain-containing protein [Vicinamibacterales bacterium]